MDETCLSQWCNYISFVCFMKGVIGSPGMVVQEASGNTWKNTRQVTKSVCKSTWDGLIEPVNPSLPSEIKIPFTWPFFGTITMPAKSLMEHMAWHFTYYSVFWFKMCQKVQIVRKFPHAWEQRCLLELDGRKEGREGKKKRKKWRDIKRKRRREGGRKEERNEGREEQRKGEREEEKGGK